MAGNRSLMNGTGFTVTVIVNGAPTQAPVSPDFGVTVYVTVCVALVGFVNVWLMDETPTACALDPVTPPVMAGAGQVYVVFTGMIVVGDASVGVTVKDNPLHIAAVWGCTTGLGFTSTITVNVGPTQNGAIPDFGVTVYVAVCGVFVGLVRVWVTDD